MQRDLTDIRWQQPLKQLRYPHLLAHDREVWSRYLDTKPKGIVAVAFDVKVGTPIDLPPDSSPAMHRLADGTGSKRIDVVILFTTHMLTVEIKPYGNHAALGQALTYYHQFLQDYRPTSPVKGAILCHEADPDIRDLVPQYHLALIELGPLVPAAQIRP